MADPSSVLGCWKITGVEPMPCGGSSLGSQNSPQDLTAATARGLAADMEIASLQDVEFTLLECGGVIWTNVVNTDLPVVNCSAYQVYEDRVSWNVFRLIRFSAWRGNIIEFVIQNLGNSADDRMMDLVLEGWCTLKCTLVRSLETDSVDFAFDFSCALQEHLYPDSCIKFKDKEFEVNSFFVPEDIRKKLEGANEVILQTILYYLYNEALSPNISAKTAEKVVDFLQVCNILPGLRELCRGYAKSVSIRRQFTNIVEDVRLAVNQILTLFGGRVSSASGQVETGRNKSAGKLVICQPARLAATIKLTCKNVVYVFLKIVQFCVRYEEVRPCLSPEESSIVANFGKARLFMLLAQEGFLKI